MLSTKPIHLYYFSGTGNTERCVNHFSQTLMQSAYRVQVYRMEDCTQPPSCANITMGLAFPVAIQSTYPLVWDFIYNLPKTDGCEVFMFDTMQSYSGGIVGPVKKVLTYKGYTCIGAREFKMSSSMNTSESKAKKGVEKNTRALDLVEQYALDLINGKTSWNRIPLLSDLMRSISSGRKIWTSMSSALSITDECILCMACVKGCPVKAIHQEAGKISIEHEKCNACMRCVSRCPQKAFRFNGKKIILSR